MTVTTETFGEIDGRPVRGFTIDQGGGLRARLIELGAALVELHVPDAAGRPADIVLGYDTLDGYRASRTFFGVVAGRYGNRIRDGRFTLDGQEFQLTRNEGAHHLHGGLRGFDKALWRGEADEGGDAVRFTHRSPDGDEGYPGTLDIAVVYRLTGDGQLHVDMAATTDRPTLCNPVQHAYFNLAGHASGPVLDQVLSFEADFYTPVDASLIPTGEVRLVAGTPFDFTAPKPIGRDMAAIDNPGGGRSADPAGGYDHNWALRGAPGTLRPAARVTDPASGRMLTLATTAPGVQFYTGGYLDGTVIGKGGTAYPRYAGFTLETQTFPNAPNVGHFPSARLDPGQTYRHRMVFGFAAG